MDKQNKNKLADKAFSRLVLTSLLGIFVCIVCLCSATWAWYNANVTTTGNKLEAGRFELTVHVENYESEAVTPSVDEDGNAVYMLNAGEIYTVTLTVSDATTVSTGFCAISANGKTYRTASINNVDGEKTFTFSLDAKADAAVSFVSMWGIPAEPDVEIGETLAVASTEATTE